MPPWAMYPIRIQTQRHISQFFAVAGTLLNKDVYKPKDNPSGAQWRRLKMVISPSTYKFPKDDIAIVITTEPFHFNALIKPIPYATRYIDYKGECLVSGYGRIHSIKPISSEKLLLARLELLPTYWCTNLHGRNMRRFICTNTKVSDVAQGDSGGPLVCRSTGEKHEDSTFGILVGIVSGTRLLRYKGKSSFFTRVSYFSKYITRENGAEGSTFVYVYHYVIVLNTFYTVF
ncbi:serine protease 52-like [Ostrinia furnacalis]|uniref:serine protease 52-like n=1 Tax=Ostrinia furnacalis TaxID=93504 RepID=UPI00103FCBAA|nr:serine protease 52-like [Ostrinia furnacalis]